MVINNLFNNVLHQKQNKKKTKTYQIQALVYYDFKHKFKLTRFRLLP